MKRPLLNQEERSIIRDIDSFYRSSLLFYLAKIKVKRDMQPYICKLLSYVDVFLSRWKSQDLYIDTHRYRYTYPKKDNNRY